MLHFLHQPCRSAICAEAKPLTPQKPATVEIGRGQSIGEAVSQWVDAAFAHHNGDVGRWDGLVHKGQRKIVMKLYLRPSREQVAGGLEARQSRRGIFLTGRVGSFCGDQGASG